MTIDDPSAHALTLSENYQQIQTAKLINLKLEIAKGIRDVKCGRIKKMDVHAIKQKARSLHK
jgi:hypothetical protein